MENLFETISASIFIILSIVHIWYGEKNQVRSLKKVTNDPLLIGSFRVMSVQGGAILFALGIFHILNVIGLITVVGITVYVPLVIILIDLLSFISIAIFKHRKLLSITLPQLLIFSTLIILEYLIIMN